MYTTCVTAIAKRKWMRMRRWPGVTVLALPTETLDGEEVGSGRTT